MLSVNQPHEQNEKCRLSIWTWNVKWSWSMFGILYLRLKLTFTMEWSYFILKSRLVGCMTFNDILLVIKIQWRRLGYLVIWVILLLYLPQNNYHFKCHNSFGVVGIQEVMYFLYSLVGWLKSIEYLGIWWWMNSLHRSLSHISASLSHKIGEFYFSFKFGILGFLHQWSLPNSLHKGWLKIVIGEFL